MSILGAIIIGAWLLILECIDLDEMARLDLELLIMPIACMILRNMLEDSHDLEGYTK